MSFNVMGACVVILVHFSRSRRAEERMALKKRVKKEEEDKKEDKKVKVKKEEGVKKEDKKVKVKKEEEVKVKKEEEVKEEEGEETDEVEKRENNDIKQNDSAIKHCDSFFTMLLEGRERESCATKTWLLNCTFRLCFPNKQTKALSILPPTCNDSTTIHPSNHSSPSFDTIPCEQPPSTRLAQHPDRNIHLRHHSEHGDRGPPTPYSR